MEEVALGSGIVGGLLAGGVCNVCVSNEGKGSRSGSRTEGLKRRSVQ